MGEAEKAAVTEVMDSGCLSGFVGSPGPGFLGGPKVRAFEEAWARHCGVRHAVSVNSATSGLIAAMGAIGIRPGDEVILPASTMSATAAAVEDCLGIVAPKVRAGCRSNYYLWAFRYHGDIARFSVALTAEGFPHMHGYVRPLYRLPAFAQDVCCPVAESLADLLLFETCAWDIDALAAMRLGEALIRAARIAA
jgi:dTDP-4-amino-4,6-dideoxygalactose transaminase